MNETGARHDGKAVLVTGGASGIGLGIVRRFAREGASVACFDLEPITAGDVDPAVLQLTGDAADESDMSDAVAAAVKAFGRLDVMVCNAGIIRVTQVVDMAFDEWKAVTETNLHGVFLGSRAAARQMIAQGGGGVIINAASGAGLRGVACLSHYCASKAAIISLTQSLSIELAPHRIRANCYVPGHIETPFWKQISEGFARRTGEAPEAVIERFRTSIPWGRFGTPDDVAAAVSWLASDEAEYVSGQAIAMNGAEFPY